jgi:hypothetical protein
LRDRSKKLFDSPLLSPFGKFQQLQEAKKNKERNNNEIVDYIAKDKK